MENGVLIEAIVMRFTSAILERILEPLEYRFSTFKGNKNIWESPKSFEFDELTIDNFRTSPNIEDMMANLSITD